MGIKKEDFVEPYFDCFRLRYSGASQQHGFYLSFGDGLNSGVPGAQRYVNCLKRMGYKSSTKVASRDDEFFDIVIQRFKDLGFDDKSVQTSITDSGKKLITSVSFGEVQEKNGLLSKFIVTALENNTLSRDEYVILKGKGASDSVLLRAMIDEKAKEEYMTKTVVSRCGCRELLPYMKDADVMDAFVQAKGRLEKASESSMPPTSIYRIGNRQEVNMWDVVTYRHKPMYDVYDIRRIKEMRERCY